MKAEVKEKDVVKHWGIWVADNNAWLVDDSGVIIAFTCPRVANAQYDIVEDTQILGDCRFEVREIT